MINKVGSATQSSPVAAAGTPNLWSINNITTPPPHHHSFLVAPPPPHHHPLTSWDHTSDHPWMSQLLLGGVADGNGKQGLREFQVKKMENNLTSDQLHMDSWSHQIQQMSAASSPKSCTSNLDFSPKSSDLKHPSSECNDSTATGGAMKKARIQASLPHSTFKVRKEKLGDRITALHQIVSPFGKTDTASVLLEAIGYIRFLHTQIEALSLPYMDSGSKATRQNPDESREKPGTDLRSRGLCLVPIACTLEVDSDVNGADYWASAFGPNLG